LGPPEVGPAAGPAGAELPGVLPARGLAPVREVGDAGGAAVGEAEADGEGVLEAVRVVHGVGGHARDRRAGQVPGEVHEVADLADDAAPADAGVVDPVVVREGARVDPVADGAG